MRPKYKSAQEHKDAIEAIVWAAPAPLTTRTISEIYNIDPKRVAGFLRLLADEGKVHSIPSGVSANGKAWKLGPAPDAPPKPQHENPDKVGNALPVRRAIVKTWELMTRRDSLVTALFGAPQVAV